MNFFSIISTMLLGSKIAEVTAQVPWLHESTYILPDSEKNNIMSLTNNLRSTINPAPNSLDFMRYNDTVEADVIKFLNARNSNWVFENETGYNNYIPASPNPMNGYSMFDRPELAKWKPYCTWWIHDTNAPHAVVKNGKKMVSDTAVTNIFKFRLKQKNCFVWSACETYPVPGFLSCLVPQSESTNGGKCAYTDKFLVRQLLPFDSAIVVGINHKGPFTPDPRKQSLSHWGWACASNGIQHVPKTGYPYTTSGARASACDSAHPRVVNGLCHVAQPKTERLRLRA